MNENQVRKTGTEKQVRTLKKRCYYTDYVNHAIRFFLSTPETIHVQGKKKADIENWCAVQYVFSCLTDEQKKVLTGVYKAHHRLPEGVRIYCEKTGTDIDKTWNLIVKTCTAIAYKRGLL